MFVGRRRQTTGRRGGGLTVGRADRDGHRRTRLRLTVQRHVVAVRGAAFRDVGRPAALGDRYARRVVVGDVGGHTADSDTVVVAVGAAGRVCDAAGVRRAFQWIL